jgi:hypothetical protein
MPNPDELLRLIGTEYQVETIIVVLFVLYIVWKLFEKGGYV